METQTSMRLTAIEESILLWERSSAPWTNQYDVSAPRLDPDRLREAWNAAFAHHDLGACAVHEDQAGPRWVPATGPIDIGPIPVVPCADDAAVRRVRDALLDEPIDLARAPLGRAVVARRPGDDLMLSSHSHVLTDGIGGLRLLQSVGRAYRGAADPPPTVDIATARRALSSPVPGRAEAWVERWRAGIAMAAEGARPRGRVAPRGGGGVGYGVVTRTLDADEVLATRRSHRVRFEDLLVGALHVAIERWNRAAGAPSERVGVSLGVNLRPADWALDVVANLAAFVSVPTEPPERADLATVLAAIGDQLEPSRRLEQARLVADAVRLTSVMPYALRRSALAALPQDRLDTIAVSNGSVILDPPTFEDGWDGDLWVSQPALPDVGLAIGVFTVAGRLRVATRFRRERFDDAGAGAFVDVVCAVLTGR